MKGCRILTDDEIKLVLNELGVRDRLLFLTCLTYGTRISEALTLTFGDVQGEVLYINSQKGSENIGFPIPDEYKRSIDDLEAWYRDKGIKITSDLPLFLSQKGKNKSITRQLASTVIKKTAKRLNLQGRVNTHSFRKCFVSKIYEMTGYDIAKTKTYSRHKSLVNLDYYLRTTEKVDLVERLHWC